MVAITYDEMTARDIPFYDQAEPGQYCGAPCWPYDEINSPGDAPDCEGDSDCGAGQVCDGGACVNE